MLNNETLIAKIEFETAENGLPTGRKKKRTAACLKEPDGDTRALVATWIPVSNLPQKQKNIGTEEKHTRQYEILDDFGRYDFI